MAPSPSTPKALRRSRERRKMTSSEATSEVAPSSEKIPERTVDSLLELQRYGWQLRAQALATKEKLVQVQTEVERRRKALVEADRQVRMLEKLRDKQGAAKETELLRQEQKILDELGQKRVRRDSLAVHGQE